MKNLNDDERLIDLKKFISNYWSYDINKITLEKSLDDMGMYGDDKYEFLIEFSEFYSVDISNLNFQDYVEPEPTILTHLDTLSRFFFKKKLKIKPDVKPIYVQNLLETICLGKWTS